MPKADILEFILAFQKKGAMRKGGKHLGWNFKQRVCVLAPPATPQAKLQPALLRHLEEYEWPPAGGWEYRSGRFVVDLPGW